MNKGQLAEEVVLDLEQMKQQQDSQQRCPYRTGKRGNPMLLFSVKHKCRLNSSL
jgi:hypothetical protein